VIAAAPRGWLIDVSIVLILIGALSKSAIVPMHFWLPGAMAAPTPVSAYLHAAAMVKAGVYLVARLAPGFAETPAWHPIVLTLGVASMLVAGWRALQVYDLKLLLAFGTVSQLGFIIVLVGTGSHDAALAGMTMMLAHALFKASLFMVVGIIDHATGTRDIRRLAGLGRRNKLLLLIGAGDNGKTTIVDAVVTALGDYAAQVSDQVLTAGVGDHPTEQMDLMGLWLAIMEELPGRRYVNVGRLKKVVGTSQYYDRDTDPDMAQEGMTGLQEFMVKPERRDQILERMEKTRKRIFG